MVVDLYLVYSFIRRLVTPFEKWDAFKTGVIDNKGNDETQYLKVLEEIVISGKTPAEKLLDDYNNLWDKNITQLIKEMSY